MSGYPLVALGEALTLSLDDVPVVPERTYRIAGVYSFGKGLIEREPRSGAEIKYSTLRRLRQDQLVYARLNAWEGALAVVPQEFDDTYVSQEFPVFDLDPAQADPRYFDHLCRWSKLWDDLFERARGMGARTGARRLRVHPEQFLSIEIPLPNVDEQRRVATKLDVDRAAFGNLLDCLTSRFDPLEMIPQVIEGLSACFNPSSRELHEIACYAGDSMHSSEASDNGLPFIGLEHLQPHTGIRTSIADPADANGPKKVFCTGDVLYPRLRPYQNKVWLADRDGVCSSDQLVLRPRDAADGTLLATLLRSRSVLDQAIGLTSSLQLPRLKQDTFAHVSVTVPKETETFLAKCVELERKLIDLHVSFSTQARVARSLDGSVLNQAFAGLL